MAVLNWPSLERHLLPKTHVWKPWVWTQEIVTNSSPLPFGPYTQPPILFCSLFKLRCCSPSIVISETFLFVSTIDVKSWLVMFGFQLSNIIPGFPRAKMYFVPPPYELSESQASENGQVSGGSCQESKWLSSFPFANRTSWEPRACQCRKTLELGIKGAGHIETSQESECQCCHLSGTAHISY